MAFLRNRSAAETPAPANRRRRRNRRDRTAETQRTSQRLDQERRRQRLAITVGVMLILVIVAIVAVGYFREYYQPPRVMAGEVRGEQFTMGDLVERIRVLQGIRRYQGGEVDLSVVPFQYLQDMLTAEILRQASPGLGIDVTDEDIDEFIRDPRNGFYPQPPPGQEADPGQLEREFQNNYQNFLTQVRLSEEEFHKIVEERLARQQLFALLGSNIENPQEQVEVEWIRLELGGQVAPGEVRERLNLEDFSTVAAEVSSPQGYADRQGYVGWTPRGAFPQLDEALFGNEEAQEGEEAVEPLAAGEISDPIVTQQGAYIVRKISGPEVRDLSDTMRFKLNSERVKEWENEQLTRGSEEGWLSINFDSDRYAWVAEQVRITAPRVQPTPGAPNQGGPNLPNQLPNQAP